MKSDLPKPIRQRWMWEPEFVKYMLVLPSVATAILVFLLYFYMGSEALGFLFLGLVGPLFWGVYAVVGRKVRAVKTSIPSGEGEVVESLIVNGNIQSPGVAILSGQRLRLIPIVGEEVTLDLDDIKSVRLVKYFNGTGLLWKKWLVLSVKPRLGFALVDPVAVRWHRTLYAAARSPHPLRG